MSAVVSRLERDMQLLCVTGVEDSLQKDVRVTLEMLRNAGIKVRRGLVSEVRSALNGILFS